MKKALNRIKNYIQLHTSDMETEDYVKVLREIAEWATSQADIFECGESLDEILNEDQTL